MSEFSPAVAVADEFSPVPSIERTAAVRISVETSVPADTDILGVPVGTSGVVPTELGVDRDALGAAGFTGALGETLAVPKAGGPPVIAVGIGDPAALDATGLRDAAGSFARATGTHGHLATTLTAAGNLAPDVAAKVVVEGALLARYRYDVLQRDPGKGLLGTLTLVAPAETAAELTAGAETGRCLAAAGALARDLANSPPAHLTATRIAEIAVEIGASTGIEVEVFDRDALVELGCGGLLGVNGGSAEPPRMVRMRYRPASDEPTGHLSLVGKALMYDSGGISLKPSDAVHATMKNDMSGGGAVLAAMSALPGLGCTTAVTAYLMCTDNLPSGTALKLGDVITIRGGTTVEVINTDAEGRLIMADALVLATEEPTDAIVDIATLTGACLRALGPEIAGVLGNDQVLVDQVRAAADVTDEPVWQLPLAARYRKYVLSPIADLKNLGGDHGGAISAALFLAEFVGTTPWAHIDIAGTAMSDNESSWHTPGCSGFGARLLVELALGFRPPQR